MSRRALEEAAARAFAESCATIAAVRGDASREAEAWTRLIDRLVALRREAGHAEPTLLLAEIVILEGWGKAEATFDVLVPSDAEAARWTADITAAIAAHAPARTRATRRQAGSVKSTRSGR